MKKPCPTSSAGERSFLELYNAFRSNKGLDLRFGHLDKLDVECDSLNDIDFVCQNSLNEIIHEAEYLVVRSPEVYFILSNIINKEERVKNNVIYYSTDLFYKRSWNEFIAMANIKSFIWYCFYALFEKSIWKNSKIVLTNRSDEAAIIRKFRTEVFVIPTRFFDVFGKGNKNLVAKINSNQIHIIFIGPAGNTPNIKSLEIISNKLIPALQSKISNKKIILNVIGDGWDSLGYSSGNLINYEIIIHGRVSDQKLDHLYKKSLFSMAYLAYGAGVKGKVIESMYHGVAVLGNNIGIEGIECEGLIGLNSIEEICLFVENILHDKKSYLSIVTSYENYLKENFSRKKIDCIFNLI